MPFFKDTFLSNVAEPEPVEPKLFEAWSRSRDYIFLIFTAVSLEDDRMKKNSFFPPVVSNYCYRTVLTF